MTVSSSIRVFHCRRSLLLGTFGRFNFVRFGFCSIGGKKAGLMTMTSPAEMRGRLGSLLESKLKGLTVSSAASVSSLESKDLSKFLATHNGSFHCDEALAVGMLRLLKQFEGWPIVRTRDMSILNECGVVVDVGAVFDSKCNRFDHHQRGFFETFSESKCTKLSSAGLIYKFYGRKIVEEVASSCGVNLSEYKLDVVHRRLYSDFVEHIDGIDNGIKQSDGQSNYTVSTHLPGRISRLNPAWNEEYNESMESENFVRAVRLVTTEFCEALVSLLSSWLPAREVVEDAIAARLQVHSSGEIIKLNQSCSWKGHIFDLEIENYNGIVTGSIKYVLYEDQSGTWRIQCVPVDEYSFTNRKSIAPESFRGLRDNELSKSWGISDCIFVHASGFIGGNKTFEGALDMAIKSLQVAE